MKNILFLTTGGTIVCEATEDGLIPSLSGQDIIERMPELKTLGKITVQDICWNPIIIRLYPEAMHSFSAEL